MKQTHMKMNMNMSYKTATHGQAAEAMINRLIKEYLTPWTLPSKAFLFSNMESRPHGRTRLGSVVKGLAKEGLELRGLSERAVLDRLYGIDAVFEIEDVNGNTQIVGVDVSVSYFAIDEKMSKLKKLEPMLRGLGITKCLVIYWSEEAPYSELKSSGKVHHIIGNVMETVDGLALTDRFIGEVTI